jgi:hypothetical protein
MKNTQKALLSILLVLVVFGVGFYFYTRNNVEDVNENSEYFTLSGIWKFDETSKETKVNMITFPDWKYTLTINSEDETKGKLNIDGYNTMIRLNVVVEKLNDSANIIFDSYSIDNQFEKYKKGDVLITIGPDSGGNLWINWHKMQPIIEENKINSFFVRQEDATMNEKDDRRKEKINFNSSPDVPQVPLSVFVGDKLGSMTVTSVEPFNFGQYSNDPGTTNLSQNNVKLKLSGAITITGMYYFVLSETGFSGYCMTDFDQESLAKLPSLSLTDRSNFFCFRNEDFVKIELGRDEEKKKVTVKIDNFEINRYPSEVVDWADLVNVVLVR